MNDLDAIADLIRAGDQLGIRPHAGEATGDFARRLANEVERKRRSGLLPLPIRATISAALLAAGIAWF